MLRMPQSVIPTAEDLRLLTVQGLLRCHIISHSHRVSIMLTVWAVLYMKNMVWVWACHETVPTSGSAGKVDNAWNANFRLYDSELGLGNFLRRTGEVEHQG